ncbi:hypothetical protein ACS0TY_024958 [Phlomoides rotata]
MMEMETLKMEAFLRILTIVVLALTASLVAFDSQTKIIFYTYAKKATFKDLNVLCVLVWIDTAAAVYNLLQLFRSCILSVFTKDQTTSDVHVAWGVYLLDQAVAYGVFAANTAALQASTLAITGEKSLQWMKLCNRFTRFCFQIGGALICGYIAAASMAIISFISAYALFRLYSPKQFLLLKRKK